MNDDMVGRGFVLVGNDGLSPLCKWEFWGQSSFHSTLQFIDTA